MNEFQATLASDGRKDTHTGKDELIYRTLPVKTGVPKFVMCYVSIC